MAAKANKADADIARQEASLERLNEELRLDLAQAVVDLAGIADPTPISDLTGAGLSLYRGDWIGAGLSLISIVPYAGDALGKTAKGARLAKKVKALKQSIEASIAATRAARTAKFALKRAESTALRARRARAKAKEIADAKKCPTCRVPEGNRFGTRSPVDGNDGRWRGERGNGDWLPDPNTAKGKKVLAVTKGKPVTFKNGYPDFSPYAQQRVEINMTGTSKDHTLADAAVRNRLDDPTWKRPKNMTWHHNEDGVTMELVPTDLNGNISHTGGDSLTKEILSDPAY